MASSDNLASLEPWMMSNFNFKPTDSWNFNLITDDSITKALQKSLSNYNNSSALLSDSFINSIINDVNNTDSTIAPAPPTPTASTVSGSDPEPVLNRKVIGPTRKVTKRKSRAGKRSQTTFIMADPANFREMVQQVTGIKFGDMGGQAVIPVMKPEAQRVSGGRMMVGSSGGCLLPTLDTSAFLLDHHRQQENMVVGSGLGSGSGSPELLSLPQSVVGHGGAAAGLGINGFSGFPTLESWKV